MAKYLEDLRAGDTFTVKIEYPVGTVLTGFVHTLIIESALGSLTPELSVSSTFGDNANDADHVAYVEATAGETEALAGGRYFYALRADNGAGSIKTLVPPPDEANDKLAVAGKA